MNVLKKMFEFQICDDQAIVHIATQDQRHTQNVIEFVNQRVPHRHIVQYQLLNGICCMSLYDSLTDTLDYYWTPTEYHTRMLHDFKYIETHF